MLAAAAAAGHIAPVASDPTSPAMSERAIERIATGTAASRSAAHDQVVVEAPLEVRCGGDALTTVMRTPGDDLELVRGLLFAEGVLAADEADRVRRPAPATLRPDEIDHVVEVDLDPALVASRWPPRSLAATAACGVCGLASIAALETRASAVGGDLVVPAALVASLPDRLRGSQRVFARTGGLHAAGLFRPDGELVALREDVGRHNAVDKLVGWALADGRVPLADHLVCVSGRLGYEIVHKAVVAGVPLLSAVSAPSSLAIDLAERFRVTLCGFVRDGHLNVYAHPARIA
jgi:FdhD protein